MTNVIFEYIYYISSIWFAISTKIEDFYILVGIKKEQNVLQGLAVLRRTLVGNTNFTNNY